MAYATIDDVVAKIGAAALAAISDDNKDGLRDDPVVNLALEDASAFADTYLDDEVPTPAPAALRNAVIAIAVNDMREARDRGTEGSRLAFQTAFKWLKDISEGKARLLPEEPETPEPTVDPGDPEATGLERIWSRESARRVF